MLPFPKETKTQPSFSKPKNILRKMDKKRTACVLFLLLLY